MSKKIVLTAIIIHVVSTLLLVVMSDFHFGNFFEFPKSCFEWYINVYAFYILVFAYAVVKQFKK